MTEMADQTTTEGVQSEMNNTVSMEQEKTRSSFQIGAILLALSVSLKIRYISFLPEIIVKNAHISQLSQFAASINTDMLATATPTISSDFHSAAGYAWVSGAYALSSAAFAPLWTKLSDIWGRKPIILTVIVWFFAGTIICSRAVNMPMLIAGRALQGMSGAAFFQMVTIVISDLFSMRKRTLFFGLLSFVSVLAGALGPILGGIFTELLSWRWCFYLNLPITGLAFFLIWTSLEVHNPRTTLMDGLKAVDWLGNISIVGMTLLVLLGLDFGGVIAPWGSAKVICLLIGGVTFGVFFFVSEKRWAKHPIIPLRILSNRSNAASFLVCSMQSFVSKIPLKDEDEKNTLFANRTSSCQVLIGAEFFLPLYFQSVKGASPLRSGVFIVPTIISQAVGSILTGVIIHRTGRYLEIMRLASLVMLLGTGLFIIFDPDTPMAVMAVVQLIAGFGSGGLFETPIIAIQANIAQDDTAAASAALGIVRYLSIAVALTVGTTVFQNSIETQQGRLQSYGLPPQIIRNITHDAAANVMGATSIRDMAQQRAIREAYSWSIRNMFIMFTGFAAVAFAASAFVDKHTLSEEHTEAKTGLKSEKQPAGGQDIALQEQTI